jgi:MYXO-CTERM domain-containing protein
MTAMVVSTGGFGLGVVAAIAAFLRRRRRRLEDRD